MDWEKNCRLANVVRHKRIEFRAFFSDWDRTCKTRSGTTPFNYTLHAGCVSRSQFQQVWVKNNPGTRSTAILWLSIFFSTWSVCLSAAGLGKNAITVPSRCRHLDDHVQEIWPWGLTTSTNTLGICMHISHLFFTPLDSFLSHLRSLMSEFSLPRPPSLLHSLAFSSGFQSRVDTWSVFLLDSNFPHFNRKKKQGDFNHLMFIRDLDEYIAAQELEEESAISNRNFRLKVT